MNKKKLVNFFTPILWLFKNIKFKVMEPLLLLLFLKSVKCSTDEFSTIHDNISVKL